MCLSAGLFPGTEYQISVQAIKGTTEGKSSSVIGATGQCQHISDPFNLMWDSVINALANSVYYQWAQNGLNFPQMDYR